ncbi:NADH-ubiquinone oxidoreductase chain G, partial [hydrothermal vent metagenome]
EEIYALKALMDALGSPNLDCRSDGSALDPKFGRASYLFNATIAGIEEADGIMIIGANPRLEAPVLNARIRKRWLSGELKVGLIGEKVDLTYDYHHIGDSPEALKTFTDHSPVSLKRPIWLVGQGALARPDGAAILSMVAQATVSTGAPTEDWNGFCVLHTAASRVGGLDLGAVPGKGGLSALRMAKAGAVDVLFLLGADEISIEPGAFVVYQGSHGDAGAHRADVILPGAAYTEKSATYVNTEGRVQRSLRAVFPPGDAREDWAILRALSEALGHTLPFDNLAALRAAMIGAVPHLGRLDTVEPADHTGIDALARAGGEVSAEPFTPAFSDFYLTNPIARASRTMAECSALARGPMAEAAE